MEKNKLIKRWPVLYRRFSSRSRLFEGLVQISCLYRWTHALHKDETSSIVCCNFCANWIVPDKDTEGWSRSILHFYREKIICNHYIHSHKVQKQKVDIEVNSIGPEKHFWSCWTYWSGKGPQCSSAFCVWCAVITAAAQIPFISYRIKSNHRLMMFTLLWLKKLQTMPNKIIQRVPEPKQKHKTQPTKIHHPQLLCSHCHPSPFPHTTKFIVRVQSPVLSVKFNAVSVLVINFYTHTNWHID